jgi:hypothetical protein
MQVGIDSFAAAFDDSSLAVSADEVAQKMVRHSEALGGVSRISFLMNAASLPHAKLMKAIEMVGTRVAPLVRATRGSAIQSHASAATAAAAR